MNEIAQYLVEQGVLFRKKKHLWMVIPVWCKYSIPGNSSGPGGIRTRDFFSAMDERLGEKGENAVHIVYYVPK
jgi:hypothetical protein